MNAVNYQKLYERTVSALGERRPKLLLHVCCGPCAAACLEELSARFDVTIFFYNPNIAPAAEYDRRLENARRLVEAMPLSPPGALSCGGIPSGGLPLRGQGPGGRAGGRRALPRLLCAAPARRRARRAGDRRGILHHDPYDRAAQERPDALRGRQGYRRGGGRGLPSLGLQEARRVRALPRGSAPHTASIARTTAAARFPTAARRSIKNKEGTTAPSLFSPNMRARDYSARMRSTSAWAARSCMARPG